ncbi:hypothetical protein ACQKWADRAFT_287545 [Trichoderma austrokoningii]
MQQSGQSSGWRAATRYGAVPRQRCSRFSAGPATPPPSFGLELSNDPPPVPSQVPSPGKRTRVATRPFGFHLQAPAETWRFPCHWPRVAVFQIGGAGCSAIDSASNQGKTVCSALWVFSHIPETGIASWLSLEIWDGDLLRGALAGSPTAS